jgi:uncharacterized membrane protein YkgB
MSKPVDSLDEMDGSIATFMRDHSITALRLALGITYTWFGALKLFGKSPVADLVRKTSLFLPKDAVVPVMGALEVTIGLGLLSRIALRLTLLLFFLQIASTFLVLVIHPGEAFQKGNPLLLTERGEFIFKNLVLLSAGLAVGSTVRYESEKTHHSITGGRHNSRSACEPPARPL